MSTSCPELCWPERAPGTGLHPRGSPPAADRTQHLLLRSSSSSAGGPGPGQAPGYGCSGSSTSSLPEGCSAAACVGRACCRRSAATLGVARETAGTPAKGHTACAGWLAELAASAHPCGLVEGALESDAERGAQDSPRPATRGSDTCSSGDAERPCADLTHLLEDAFAGAAPSWPGRDWVQGPGQQGAEAAQTGLHMSLASFCEGPLWRSTSRLPLDVQQCTHRASSPKAQGGPP